MGDSWISKHVSCSCSVPPDELICSYLWKLSYFTWCNLHLALVSIFIYNRKNLLIFFTQLVVMVKWKPFQKGKQYSSYSIIISFLQWDPFLLQCESFNALKSWRFIHNLKWLWCAVATCTCIIYVTVRSMHHSFYKHFAITIQKDTCMTCELLWGEGYAINLW